MGTGTREYKAFVEADEGCFALPRDVFRAELDAINSRRRNFGLKTLEYYTGSAPAVERGLFGVGLSGGGIRSATFCLGVLQAIERAQLEQANNSSSRENHERSIQQDKGAVQRSGKGFFRHVDYLSTVSGGGYLGGCLSSIYAGNERADELQFPFLHSPGQPESRLFKHLREYANYLKPAQFLSGFRLPAVTLRGLLINSIILLPLVLVSVVFTSLFFRSDIRHALQTYRGEYIMEGTTNWMPGKPLKPQIIDLRTEIGWPEQKRGLHSLLVGPEQYLNPDSEITRIGPGKWLVDDQLPEEVRIGITPSLAAKNENIVLTSWSEENFHYRLLQLFSQVTSGDKQHAYPEWIINRWFCDAHTYTIPIASCMRKREDGKIEVRLGEYVGVKKYVVLSGLPLNSFSPKGVRIGQGKWLFSGDQAEKLTFDFFMPAPKQQRHIHFTGWQTRDAEYTVPGEVIKAATISSHRGRVLLEPLVNGSNMVAGDPLEIEGVVDFYRKLGVDPDDEMREWVIYTNLKHDGVPEKNAPTSASETALDQELWITSSARLERAITEYTAGPAKQDNTTEDKKKISFTVEIHKPAKAENYLNPVERMYRDARNGLLFVAVFGALLLLASPTTLVRRIQPVDQEWKSRDLLTRGCGFVLLIMLVIATFCLQPLFIFGFYQLKANAHQFELMAFIDMLQVVGAAAVLVISAISSSLGLLSGKKKNTWLTHTAMGLAGPLLLWFLYLYLCGWILNPDNIPGFLDFAHDSILLLFIGAALLIWVMSRLFYNVNYTSLHPFYRDRLSKAFMISVDDNGELLEHNDSQKLQNLNIDCAPYHLINTTLNIREKGNVGHRGRNADFFIFSRNYIGSQLTGYVNTFDYEKLDSHMGLATAMAISGGAVAPQMGRGTKKSLSTVMAMFNLRLGYWVQNPRRVVGSLIRAKVGPFYLLKEMFGLLHKRSKCLYLSDGGHLENIGLYELVRRRCKYIMIIDGEADANMEFSGLVDAIRMIRIDMGIKVDICLDSIYQNNEQKGDDNQSQKVKMHCAHGLIYYDDNGSESENTGHLLYIKSSYRGDHGSVVERYRRQHPAFPHESTADQFFDEEQFEAYRDLGAYIGARVFKTVTGENGAECGRLPQEKPFNFFQALFESQKAAQ